MALAGFERRFLRGQAHALKSIVHIGKQGLTEALVGEVGRALEHHELIKVRFLDLKDEKKELTTELATRCHAEAITILGHQAVLFRQHPDPDKRKIQFPKR